MKRTIVVLTVLIGIFFVSSSQAAQSVFRPHGWGLYMGNSHIRHGDDFSYGINYSYRAYRYFSWGIDYKRTEHGASGAGVNTAALNLVWHVTQESMVGIGFGQQDIGGRIDEQDSLVRLRFGYDIGAAGIGIQPLIEFDFVDGDTNTVIGFNLYKAF